MLLFVLKFLANVFFHLALLGEATITVILLIGITSYHQLMAAFSIYNLNHLQAYLSVLFSTIMSNESKK